MDNIEDTKSKLITLKEDPEVQDIVVNSGINHVTLLEDHDNKSMITIKISSLNKVHRILDSINVDYTDEQIKKLYKTLIDTEIYESTYSGYINESSTFGTIKDIRIEDNDIFMVLKVNLKNKIGNNDICIKYEEEKNKEIKINAYFIRYGIQFII